MPDTVSILVFMDDSLQRASCILNPVSYFVVSILVFMDDSLQHPTTHQRVVVLQRGIKGQQGQHLSPTG
jgi:hypothetical protein